MTATTQRTTTVAAAASGPRRSTVTTTHGRRAPVVAGWLAIPLLASLLLAPSVPAQVPAVDPLDETDPVAADAGDPFDPVADADAGGLPWAWTLEARLRGDRVADLPAERETLERVRGRVRIGLDGWLGEAVELGVGVKLAQGSDDNADNRRNNDNERSDAFSLDRIVLRWQLGERTRLSAGKDALALTLTPMLWDPDLRPAGLAIEHALALGDFDRLVLGAGWQRGQHLYGDDSRIASGQLAWHVREGAPFGASVLLGLLHFDRLETLTRQGLARTNRIVGGRLASDFHLLDLLLVGRAELAGRPLVARLDLVRNLGADADRDGARLDVAWGDAGQARGWAMGASVQRIQRDAVMAAFNDDDWWFHSAVRGYSLWFAYGIDSHWQLRLSGFVETRDGLDESTDRLLLDVEARW